MDPTEPILAAIRDKGFNVELGTMGYQVKLVATHTSGDIFEVMDNDTYFAASSILEQITEKGY